MSNWFRRLGLMLCGPFTTTKWLFYEFTGTDQETLQAEADAGAHLARKLRKNYPVFRNRSYQQYLRDMGAYLERFLPPNGYQFTYLPLASQSINAFAIPGGNVFVSRGLLEFTEWERDEIAFAVAHEMGHIIRGHATDKLVASTIKSGASIFIRTFRVPKVVASLSNAYVFSEYSQDCEFEADQFAARLLHSANMNPMAGAAFLRRLDMLSSRDCSPVTNRFFSSHPAIFDRLRHIEKLFP